MTDTRSLAAKVHDVLQSTLGEWTAGVAARADKDTDAKACIGGMDRGTVMYGASLTKQFIGILMAQLADSGDIHTEQSVREFLPGLPAWADAVRIRHLLSHTSGFPASAVLTQQLGLPTDVEGERQWNNAMVLEALSAQTTPQRAPGVTYEYSNAGYVCLAEIIQRVCNEPIEQIAHDRLFAPLGMKKSRLRPGEDTPDTIGDGGLWTTVDDLLIWNDAMNARHFGQRIHQIAETPGHLADGTALDYAWGLRVTTQAGERTFSHGGGWPGRCAKTIRQPEAGISLALLTTCSDVERINNAASQVLNIMQQKN